MARRPLKRRAASLVIREMQIKTTARYRCTPTGKAAAGTTQKGKCVSEALDDQTLRTSLVGLGAAESPWKTVWGCLKKLNGITTQPCHSTPRCVARRTEDRDRVHHSTVSTDENSRNVPQHMDGKARRAL